MKRPHVLYVHPNWKQHPWMRQAVHDWVDEGLNLGEPRSVRPLDDAVLAGTRMKPKARGRKPDIEAGHARRIAETIACRSKGTTRLRALIEIQVDGPPAVRKRLAEQDLRWWERQQRKFRRNSK